MRMPTDGQAATAGGWLLEGRAALVTGGGQGLGRAFCRALAGAGMRVAVADRNRSGAEAVASEVALAGGRAAAVHVDVAEEASVASAIEAAERELGPIDVLVNGAAVFSTLRRRPFTEITVAEWDEVMAVNLRGVFLTCRALAPRMVERGYGKIVNISSATVWSGRPFYIHYVSSKAAVIGFTRALANELGPHGVRVNAITPGATRTEVERATMTAREWEQAAERTALRREEVPGDLVGAVLFLASPASDFITGQTLNVDGGVDFH
jgi:3-oxoacyl-[acyl-carrier protein] reductase